MIARWRNVFESGRRTVGWNYRLRNRLITNAFLGVAFAISAFSLAGMWHLAETRHFDPDEFQHTHIIWNIYQGLQIYVDFFEHHGPLYPALASLLLQFMPHDVASFETLIYLRKFNILLITACAALVLLISRTIHKSPVVAAFAVTVFLSWTTVQSKGVEIRPDTIQTLFWLVALYFLTIAMPQQVPRRLTLFVAGYMLGLMISTNLKSVLGCLGLAFFLFHEAIARKAYQLTILRVKWMMFGGVCSLLTILAPFAMQGTLTAVWESNVTHNFTAIAQWERSTLRNRVIESNFSKDHALLIFTLLGLLPFSFRKSQHSRLLLLAILPFGYGVYKGLFSQIYLAFLPILSIFAALGFYTCVIQPGLRAGPAGLVALIPAALLLPLIFDQRVSHFIPTDFSARSFQKSKQSIEWTLSNLSRDEVTVASWDHCGSYIFNRDPDYYWVPMMSQFKARQLEILESLKSKYYLGEVLLPPETELHEYISKHYTKVPSTVCRWIRS